MTPNRPRRRLFPTLASAAAAAAALLLVAPGVAVDGAAAAAAGGGGRCERLPTSLTYSQDAAPADASAILRVVVERINRDVAGVVDVEVQWSGAELHKKVGERIVKCTVTRMADSVEGAKAEDVLEEQGREVVRQCFEVPFTVLDVDECTVPKTNPMAHRCHPSTLCVNTLGSYECLCPSTSSKLDAKHAANNPGFWQQLSQEPRSPWELSLASSSESSCPNAPSTRGCCEEDGHSKDGSYCRSSFRCPVDPCAKSKAAACASNALCERTVSPLAHPNYKCQCPSGLMGNGYPCRSNVKRRVEPKVKYDGATPTEETRKALDANLICGCSEPKVDACDGFPKCPGNNEMCTVGSDDKPACTCRDGYVRDPDYGCVDESPPVLSLRPDPVHGLDPETGVTHLTQGDRYEEHGVDIMDDNAEEYLRSLKIAYSRPLPHGCLLEMGQFHVSYTVATPWTEPEFVTANRTVIIDNINECLVKEGVGVGANCPELVAECDTEAGAACVDEIGTYTCRCPGGTEGDGFKPVPRLSPDGRGGFDGSMVPKGYKGGTGCRDTSKPVIKLLGPNPKRFRVAKAGVVKAVMKDAEDDESNARVEALLAEQRSAYESDIRSIIKATSGAELCATNGKANVRPSDCVHAEDHTYKGVVDLTSRVSVGEPVLKDGVSFQWRVPYNVVDDAGNEAKTVWRDVVVEEVDIDDFETKARSDIVAGRRDEVERAVNEALAKERKKQRSGINKTPDCPPCDPCNCNGVQKQQRNSGRDMLSNEECNARCDSKVAAALSTRSSDGMVCTPSYMEGDSKAPSHQIVQEMLIFIEGLLGPSAMMLVLLGCTVVTTLYVLRRVITALFFSTGPNVRTYYHTREDDERERAMLQSVSYYRSPTPSAGSRQSPGSVSSSTSAPRPPPTASISSQRQNGIFSPQTNGFRANGTPNSTQSGQGQAAYSSPFRSSDGTDNIYQSMSPITPVRNNTPAQSQGSASQSSRYSN